MIVFFMFTLSDDWYLLPICQLSDDGSWYWRSFVLIKVELFRTLSLAGETKTTWEYLTKGLNCWIWSCMIKRIIEPLDFLLHKASRLSWCWEWDLLWLLEPLLDPGVLLLLLLISLKFFLLKSTPIGVGSWEPKIGLWGIED